VTAPKHPFNDSPRNVGDGVQPRIQGNRMLDTESMHEDLEIGRLRRALDPEHPDPERLWERVRSVMTSAQPLDSHAEQEPISKWNSNIRSRGGAPVPTYSIPHASVLVAAVIVLIVIVVAAVGVFHGSGQRRINPESAPVSPASSPKQSSASPRPSVPKGFRDCSTPLGAGSYCVETPECWTGIRGYADAPLIAEPVGCKSAHVYETFAAGFLATTPRRQSELEALPEVKKLCSVRTLTTIVDSARNPVSRWEIQAIPRQTKADRFSFRCLVGAGGVRTEPLHFRNL
jgi:hypothetical protein